MISTLLALTLSLLVLTPVAAPAQSPGAEAEAILEAARIFGEAPYAEIRTELQVQEQSRRRSRTVSLLYAEEAPERRFVFAQVVEPPFLSNMRFLMRQESLEETRLWLSTSRGVRELSGTGDNERLFGSDFTMTELLGFPGGGYAPEYLGTEMVEGYETEVVRGRLRDPESAYDSFVLRKDAETDIIIWIEFFRQNRLTKEYRLLELDTAAGLPYTRRARMETYSAESHTEMTVEAISFPELIPEVQFRTGALE